MSYLPTGPASATVLGAIKVGTGLSPAGDGTTSVLFGTTAGTSAQGNDSRVTGAEQTANKGATNGYASLVGGTVPLSQIPASITGGVNYQGTWNASTNTPTLTSSTGTKGFLYKVSVAGTTTLDGLSQWNVGDEVVFDGTTWDKLDGLASEVITVAGRTGAVVLTTNDIGFITNTYTAAGPIAVTDDESVINSGSAITMTLAAGTVSHLINIKRYGTGVVTVTANMDGASQSVVLNTTGTIRECLSLRWNVGLTSWLVE